ncbi:MAG: hypothetical protein NTW19_04500 [Planctomycetota bacterium]|nr:hypothetical protein [Planctomycetota bacterium]
MKASYLFRVVQGFYWLGLGAWFGGLVMLAITAAITFRTVREYQPTIENWPQYQPAMAEHDAPILAGGIVGNVLHGLAAMQIVCAAFVGGCVVLQCTVFKKQLVGGPTGRANLLRVALVVLPVGVLAADQLVISPRIWTQREAMYDSDQPEAVRTEAHAEFDRLHKLDERVVGVSVWLLAGAVFASTFAFKTEP